jgi:hypothetical protein
MLYPEIAGDKKPTYHITLKVLKLGRRDAVLGKVRAHIDGLWLALSLCDLLFVLSTNQVA